MAEIGRNIKLIRTAVGLKQIDLAKRCGCTNTFLSAVETGRYKANPALLARIAKGLNTSVEVLKGETRAGE